MSNEKNGLKEYSIIIQKDTHEKYIIKSFTKLFLNEEIGFVDTIAYQKDYDDDDDDNTKDETLFIINYENLNKYFITETSFEENGFSPKTIGELLDIRPSRAKELFWAIINSNYNKDAIDYQKLTSVTGDHMFDGEIFVKDLLNHFKFKNNPKLDSEKNHKMIARNKILYSHEHRFKEYFNLATDFSKNLTIICRKDGEFSAEELREDYLIPILNNVTPDCPVNIELDNIEESSLRFFREAFRWLREYFSPKHIRGSIKFIGGNKIINNYIKMVFKELD